MLNSLLPVLLRIAPFLLRMAGARKAADALQSILRGISDGTKTQLDAEVEITRALAEAEAEMAQHQASVIKAEITSESWLVRNWRPMVALTSFFTYWFVIFLYPFALAYDLLPPVRFGEVGLANLFWLTVICVGGYMGLRTVEKVTRSR